VNPRLDTVDGVPVYPDVASIPAPVDCAVVALPASLVPSAVEECGRAGILQVLLLGAGFGELGDEGRELERRTLDQAHRYGVRFVGPNSAGIVNVAGSVALSMTSVLGGRRIPDPGRVALLLQSGAMGSSLLDRMAANGAGVSHMVSLGNQIDLDVADFLAHCATDDATAAVCVYLESFHDGPRLREAIELVEGSGKRVFVLLAGGSRLGEQAAVTHTGRIVGRHGLEAAIVDAAGATRVDDVDTLWQAAHLATTGSRTHGGSRVGVLTISGGLSVLTADALGKQGGFEMPAPSELTRQWVRDVVPDYAELANPLDLGSGTMPDGFHPALLAFGADPSFDVVAVVLPVVAPWWQEQVAAAIVDAAAVLAKPLVVCWTAGPTNDEGRSVLRAGGVSLVETPSALARLLTAHRGPHLPAEQAAPGASTSTDRRVEAGPDLLRALADAGCQVPAMEVADSVEGAAAAAERLGWPVALKALVPGTAHKTDAGLVRTGIADRVGLLDAAAAMLAVPAGAPAVESWLVQAMAAPGVELVLSIRRDAGLGEFAGIGMGGILVEILGEVRYAPLPITVARLRDLLRRLPGSALLLGYRGSPPVDVDWLHRAIEAMAEVAREIDATELEANPAIVGASGGMVVDALAVRRGG
jgi:acyl-CoA synthetase (NDP forming)